MRRQGWRAGRSRQTGVVLVLYTIGALAVLVAAGLTFDLGLAYITKTKLQNAVDAAAMAGAYTLHRTFSPDAAQEQALATFALNASGFDAGVVPTVQMSATLEPWVNSGIVPRFVYVTYQDLPIPAIFAGLVPGFKGSLTVSAGAVAGGIPVGEICGGVPMAMCGTPGDTDCSDGSCYGIPSGEVEIKSPNQIGPGNYGLVVLGRRGAAAVRRGMAGGAAGFCFKPGDSLQTQSGVASGPVAAGLNTRFGMYSQGLSPAEYPPDVVTTNGPGIGYTLYQVQLGNEALWDNHTGVPQRRVMTVPVIDCGGGVNGRQRVPTLGGMCMFLRRTVDPSNGTVYGEIAPTCLAHGGLAEDPEPGGPVKISLYQDVVGG